MMGQDATVGDVGEQAITFLDLFSGIGAMRLGFEGACEAAGLKPTCVGFSEIDEDAIRVYLRRFPDTPALGDIKDLAGSGRIPECDIVLAGFCCQAFSRAGSELGFEDARGTLFFSLASIIESRRPRAFLLENVDHLVRHDNGRTLRRIMEILGRLGYRTTWQILNSRDFGVPQNRPRIFLVGFRDGGDGFLFPKPTDAPRMLRDVLESAPVHCRHYLSEQYLDGVRRHKARHAAKGNGFGYQVLDPATDVASTLVCGGMGRERNLVVDRRIHEFPVLPRRTTPVSRECVRSLTPLEWERLQGLPDGFTAGQADCRRYRQLGNAVTVPVVKAVSLELLAALGRGQRVGGAGAVIPAHDAQQISPVSAPNGSGGPAAFTFADLCSGIGGFRLAAEALGGRCVMSSEIDRIAREVYRANFGEWPSGDIRQVRGADVPDHDVLCCGFPCQPFSHCGDRRGFADMARGTIIFELSRVSEAKRPRLILAENVVGLVSHDGGRTFAAIRKAFEDLGYRVFWEVLNASLFGSPTERERVYIVAFRDDLDVVSFEFPRPTFEPVRLADVLLPDSATDRWVVRRSDIHIDHEAVARANGETHLGLVSVGRVGDREPAGQGYRIYLDKGHAITFCARGGGIGAKTGLYWVNGRVRRLDPREGLRVMGYPDGFVIPESIRPDQTRTLIGNTVVVPLVRMVLESALAAASIRGIPKDAGAPADGGSEAIALRDSPAPSECGAASRLKLLANGSSKKGPLVWSFSIGMPGNRCPFASSICARLCYAEVGKFPLNARRYTACLGATRKQDFVERMLEEIRGLAWRCPGRGVAICIHEKGDFHSLDYLRRWGQVIRKARTIPNISFFVYTRAWISPAFRAELDRIAASCPNVRINLSVDREMVAKHGLPARVGDGLLVFLAETDDDLPPAGVDVALRNLRILGHDPMDRLGGSLVCPNESGLYVAAENGRPMIKGGKTIRVRCQDCRLCIDRSLDGWDGVKASYADSSSGNGTADVRDLHGAGRG